MVKSSVLLLLLCSFSFGCLCESNMQKASQDIIKEISTDGVVKSANNVAEINSLLLQNTVLNKLKSIDIDSEIELLKNELIYLKKIRKNLNNYKRLTL